MATETDVSVKFGASTADFNAGVDQVKEKLAEVGESGEGLAGSFEKMKSAAEAFISAFAIEKVIEFVHHIAELGEQIERTSQITGLSTGEVQQLQFAIKMTGGDAEAATMSLVRFEKNIAQAAEGAGPAAQAFKNLGINVKDADGNIRPLMEILGDVADRFHATADGAIKADYALTLGSRTFFQMIPLLNQGRDGLKGMGDQFQRIGAELAPKEVEALESLHKSFLLLDSTTGNFAKHLVADLAPSIERVTRALTDMMAAMNSSSEGRAAGLVDWMTGIQRRGQAAAIPGAEAGGSSEGTKPSLPPLAGGADDNSAALAQISANMQIAKYRLETEKALLQQEAAYHQITKAQEIEQEKQFVDRTFAIDEAALQERLKLYAQDSGEYAKTLNQMRVLAAQHTAAIAKLDAQMAQANQQAAQQSYRSWQQALQPIERAFDTMLTGVLQGTETLSQAMANAFANAALSVVESILKVIAEWLIFEAVTEGQGSWKDFVAIQGGGSGGGGGFLGTIGKILSFDTGTDYVPATGLALIHQGEMVIPAQQAQAIRDGASLGSGGSTNVSISVQAIDTQTGMQFIKSQAQAIASVVSSQIRNQNSNLSSLARTA